MSDTVTATYGEAEPTTDNAATDNAAAATDDGTVRLSGPNQRRVDLLVGLIGKRIEVVVQHNIRGAKPDARVVAGKVLAFAQKLGHDQGRENGEFTSPRGLVVQEDGIVEPHSVWFITVRTIESYRVLNQ